MKNIESIFDFFLKNKLNVPKEEEANKVFASMIALYNYKKEKDFDLQTVIKMIILNNINTDNLTNKKEVNNILNVFHNLETKESVEAHRCINIAKKLNPLGIEESIDKIYGRLLISVGIDIESYLKLEFQKLYEIIIKITDIELENEKQTRLKYHFYNTYNVTKEYALLISFLEELISIKINELTSKENHKFEKLYEEQKGFYRSMPILSGVLEKTKKL